MLKILEQIPKELISGSHMDLYKILPDLSLFYFKGNKKEPLFLSCLIHGNEYSGFLVIQELLKKYGPQDWPRSVYLLFGNLSAARYGRRHLDQQPDYNRIWKDGKSLQDNRTIEILDFLKDEKLFASIDMHNNTGRNPVYSVITEFEKSHMNLAALAGKLSTYFPEKQGSVTENLSLLCPSMTIEAGQPGTPEGVQTCLTVIEKLMVLDEIPDQPVNSLDLSLLDCVGTIKIPQQATVGFENEKADIVFEKDFDLLNFTEIKPGKIFALCKNGYFLELKDNNGVDIGAEYFDYKDGQIITRKEIIPAMITLDKTILKSDCVCYVMRKIKL